MSTTARFVVACKRLGGLEWAVEFRADRAEMNTANIRFCCVLVWPGSWSQPIVVWGFQVGCHWSWLRPTRP